MHEGCFRRMICYGTLGIYLSGSSQYYFSLYNIYLGKEVIILLSFTSDFAQGSVSVVLRGPSTELGIKFWTLAQQVPYLLYCVSGFLIIFWRIVTTVDNSIRQRWHFPFEQKGKLTYFSVKKMPPGQKSWSFLPIIKESCFSPITEASAWAVSNIWDFSQPLEEQKWTQMGLLWLLLLLQAIKSLSLDLGSLQARLPVSLQAGWNFRLSNSS